jgi:uncharacterized protein YrrD
MGSYTEVVSHGLKAIKYTEPGAEPQIIVALTNHPINILVSDKVVIQIPQSGTVARVNMRKKDMRTFAGMCVERDILEDVYGLPPKRRGVVYIVSEPVFRALNGSRNDVVFPGRRIKGRSDYVITNLKE